MRITTDYRSGSNDNYKRFHKEHPEIEISLSDWRNILYTYTELFREYLLETGEKGKLPAGLGEFAVEKKKNKKTITIDGKEKIILPVDWVKSKQKGKKIYNLNYHTEGYYFKWRWFRDVAKFRFSRLWYFKAARPTSRLVAHYLKIDKEYQHKYLEWSSLHK